MNNLKLIFQAIFDQFIDDECFAKAAALSFATLLSIVPLTVVSLGILSAFPAFEVLSQQIQAFIFENFVADSAQTLQQHFQGFVHHAKQLSLTGVLSLIASALLMVWNMERAFNAIWHVKQGRPWVSALLLYWAVLTMTPILLCSAWAMTGYLSTVSHVQFWWGSVPWDYPLSAGFLYVMAFSLLYLTVPNTAVRLRYAFTGGVVVTCLFIIVQGLLGLYFAYFPFYQLIYGALAAVPIALIGLYTLWLIVLFGGVVSYVLENRKSLM